MPNKPEEEKAEPLIPTPALREQARITGPTIGKGACVRNSCVEVADAAVHGARLHRGLEALADTSARL